MSSKEAFAARLKQLRATAGITQGRLAELCGMHRLSIAKLEQGQYSPSWDAVQVIAAALGVTCEAFASVPQDKAAASKPAKPKRGKIR